jgi:hypothetical protein
MNKKDFIIYRIVTGVFTAHMLMTIVIYFFNYDMVAEMFTSLGVSPSIIYPLAVVKMLGLIAIWTNKSRILKELAYAGFALDFILAASAHLIANDGGFVPPLVAMAFLITSFVYHRKLSDKKQLDVNNFIA